MLIDFQHEIQRCKEYKNSIEFTQCRTWTEVCLYYSRYFLSQNSRVLCDRWILINIANIEMDLLDFVSSKIVFSHTSRYT